MILRYGFMVGPNIPRALSRLTDIGAALEPSGTTYFLSRQTILPSKKPGMAKWREGIFAILMRNDDTASATYRLPVNRVVELGSHVEI